MRNKWFLLCLLLSVVCINFIIAEEFGYNLLETGKGLFPPTNTSKFTVNASDLWLTNEGIKDNVIDLKTSEFTNDLGWDPDTNASECGDGEYLDGEGICINLNATITHLSNVNGTNIDVLKIFSKDWTNVTLTESQIIDLVHSVNDTNLNVLKINATNGTFKNIFVRMVEVADDFRLHGTKVFKIHRNTASANAVTGHPVFSSDHDGVNNEPVLVFTESAREDLDFDVPASPYPQFWIQDGSEDVTKILKLFHNGSDGVIESAQGVFISNVTSDNFTTKDLKVTDLVNCNTIDTGAGGRLRCGNDNTNCGGSTGSCGGEFGVCAITSDSGCLTYIGTPETPHLYNYNGTFLRKVAHNLLELKGASLIPLDEFGYDENSNFTFTIKNLKEEREYFDYIVLNQRCHLDNKMKYKRYYSNVNELNEDDEEYLFLEQYHNGTFRFEGITIPAYCSGADFINYQLEIGGYYENV